MPKVPTTALTVATPVVLGAVATPGNPGNLSIPPGDNASLVTMRNPGTATIVIEGSDDNGVSWAPKAALSQLDNTSVSSGASGFTPTAGVNTSYLIPHAGCNQLRVRATAVTGSPTVSITSITCPPLGLF